MSENTETGKEVAVVEENAVATVPQTEEVISGVIVSEDPFQMTIEQAHKLIGKQREMYDLCRTVASQLLETSDKYYMSQLSCKDPADWKGPKPGELPVLKKSAADKLIGFFHIGMFPEVKKIDGGYEVTIIGRDRAGGYIGTGKGICTRYEKKFSWIKASDEEYDAANESDRRIIVRKYGRNEYKNKQIKTDERGMAHTLISMAEKRARAAFIRKLMPVLDDVSFEGEAYEADYQYADESTEPSSSDQVMTDSEIKTFYDGLKKKYKMPAIKEAFKVVTNSETLGGMTEGQSLDITTHLKDNFGDSNV